MDIDRFVEERSGDWKRTEELLDQAAHSSVRRLGRERTLEILARYRRAATDLNRMRGFTANAELLGRLNQIVGRGYRFLYRGAGEGRSARAVWRFFVSDVPATFRREARHVLATALVFGLGALFGFAAVLDDPANARALVPPEFFEESPRERVRSIEREEERVGDVDTAASFGAFLYTHNIQVSILAFSFVASTLLLGYFVLFLNGWILGAVLAQYLLDGVGVFFFAWVGPHGALEIPAILFAAAAGHRVGTALYFPGDRSRADALRDAFPSAWRMMVLSALVLVAAGLIEGSFSQFSVKTVPYGAKIGVAAALFAGLLLYLFVQRRGKKS
ncbi:MAG: stage II sporulation protein M [Planctomycetes bacterium]|nr:stage II sporulation protein M [Planctomycetota bacterium]